MARRLRLELSTGEISTEALVRDVWEAGQKKPAWYRALLILGAMDSGRSLEEWANLSIGWRNAYLLQLREKWFGSQMGCVDRCPHCGAPNEFEINVQDLLSVQAGALAEDHGTPQDESGRGLRTTQGELEIKFRLLTSYDLAEISACRDWDKGRAWGITGCIEALLCNGEPMDITELTEEEIAVLGDCLDEADPLSCTSYFLNCSECGEEWQGEFDIVRYLWQELTGVVLRLLDDVDILARAYGWSEEEILSLSKPRRAYYLKKVGIR